MYGLVCGMALTIALQFGGLFGRVGSVRSDVVTKAVEQWEQESSITVSDTIERRLSEAIPVRVTRLTGQGALGIVGPRVDTTFMAQTLTESYLYWARDRAREGSPNITTLDAASPDDVTSQLAAFEAAMQPVMAARKLGRIEVTSEPATAPIKIDDRLMGNTQNVFVASEGAHVVIVSPDGKQTCTATVTVQEGRTVKVDCR